MNSKLSLRPPDKFCFRHVTDIVDGVIDLGCKSSQSIVVIVFTMKGECHDWHIINGMWFYERLLDTPGNSVEICGEFLVQPDDGCLKALPDKEPYYKQTLTLHGSGIYIFYPRQFVEQFFHGDRKPFFHFFWGGTRHGNHDIDHRHFDLWFLFTGKHYDGQISQQQRGDNTERC